MKQALLLVATLWVITVVDAQPYSAERNVMMKIVTTLPTSPVNRHYAGNRAPLLPSPLIKLPTGSIRPEGWLRQQLELMAEVSPDT